MIIDWVVDLMDALGAPGVGVAIALENVFPPLPSEVFLPLAGFAAARGEMSLGAAIAWTTAGSLVGALVLYGLGAALGRSRLRALVDRMPLVALRDVDRAEEWFARHGAAAVFLGRMVPLVRSLISVPAGVERMPVALFAAPDRRREPGLEHRLRLRRVRAGRELAGGRAVRGGGVEGRARGGAAGGGVVRGEPAARARPARPSLGSARCR